VDVRFEDIADAPLFCRRRSEKAPRIALRIDNDRFAVRGNDIAIIPETGRDKKFVVHRTLHLDHTSRVVKTQAGCAW
jgi:hypothetical protein